MSSETIEQRIVLLFGPGPEAETSTALALESSQLVSLLKGASPAVDVGVISLGLSRTIPGTSGHIRLDGPVSSFTDRALKAVGAYALNKQFATFPIGRLLNSLGPVDPNRVFWRAVKRHPEAMRLLKSANIAVATDLAATKTAWLAVHCGWVDDAFYDRHCASVGISWQLPSGAES